MNTPVLGRELRLVAANAGDFEVLVRLRIEAMRESLERIGRFDEQRARERFRAAFSPAYTRRVLLGGELVGFLTLKPDAGDLLLDHLYIRPQAQKRGIGGALLGIVFAEAEAAGLTVRVGALRESASNRFYIRHGFVLVGESEWDLYYTRAPMPRASAP